MSRTREELDAARKELEQRRQTFLDKQKVRQRASDQIDELERVIESLRQENMSLKECCKTLRKDNDRVYAGHRGLEEEINFLKYRISTLDKLHESVVQRTGIHDGTLKKYKCMYPFERIELLPRGEVYTCCSGHIKHDYYIGNFYEQFFEEIWNSERAMKLRYSVSNGNFEYCMENCKWLHKENIESMVDTGDLNPIVKRTDEDAVESWKECKLDVMPRFITLTCDESCNLACPTCRSSIKALGKKDAEVLYERLQNIIRPMLQNCEQLSALASGDIFASYALMKFYKTLTIEEFPKLTLYIITNLQLLTPKKWNELKNLHTIPIRLSVSVDAADRGVYEKNRGGRLGCIMC